MIVRNTYWLTVALLSAACGATPLAPRFVTPVAPGEAAVARDISHAPARDERPVIVGVRSDKPGLCAWDLTGARLWELPVQVASAPLVVADAVIVQEAERIAIYELTSGKLRAALDGDGKLVGADGTSGNIALTVTYKEADGSVRGELTFVAQGSVRWKKELNQPVGTPALVGARVLLPWATTRLSVLSADDGTEIARWTFHNMMVGQARVERGRVYVGQLGLLPVDERLPAHQEGPVSLIAPVKRVLPGQPPLMRDGYASVAPVNHASHKVALEWHLSTAEEPGVAGDVALLRFYRLAFGLSAQRDEVQWARAFEHDLVGASAEADGAFIVDDQGSLRFLDRSGATRAQVELKVPLAVATIRADGFVPPGAAQSGALEAPSGSLHDQLLAAAQLDDDRVFPARAFSVQHLAKLSDLSITRELIALCARRGAGTNALQVTACNELGQRDGSSADILEALRQKASFLEDTGAPPVGALAQAAARMQLKQAGPLLLSHAEDPHTAASDLPALFQALEKLDYQAALPQLERFVRLHHAEPAGSDLMPALSTALSVIGNMRAKTARTTLANVAADELALEGVRKDAKSALSVLDQPPAAREAKKSEAPAAKAKQSAKAAEPETDPRPQALDAEAIQKTFRPLRAALEHCLVSDPGEPKSARISMIVAGDGRMEGFVVTPTSLQGCTDAILRTARFPATRLARQHVIQTVYAPLAERAAPEAKDSAAPARTQPARAKTE
jgi:hypothetical protein